MIKINNISKIIKNKRFELTVVFLALLVIAMLAAVSSASQSSAAAAFPGVPSLFHNDRAFVVDDIMPLYVIDGEFYVPREFIRELNYIDMDTRDNFREDFYIWYNKSRWIAFKVSADRAMTLFDENIPCKVYIIAGVTYLPAVLVAESLGLRWEYNEQYNSFRIKESGARLTLDELLAPYIARIPTTPAPETTTAAPPAATTQRPVTPRPPAAVTPPPAAQPQTQPAGGEPAPPRPNNNAGPNTNNPPPADTVDTADPAGSVPAIPAPRPPADEPVAEEPTTAENTQEIENHVMFYGSESAGRDDPGAPLNEIDEVLDILGRHDMRATFFLSGGEIAENPDALRKIYASGHGLGIRFESSDELEPVNDLIYSIVKHKTRLCMLDGGTGDINNTDSIDNIDSEGFDEGELNQLGYYLCSRSVDIDSLGSDLDLDEMIEFIKQRTTNVFAFDLAGGFGSFLELSAQAAKTKFYINFSHINNANIADIKRQIKEIG